MNDTVIYLVRHAETVDENGIRNTNEDSQMINEKEILSVEGEEQAKKLSENDELKNLDIIWSSSYTRAKATAKYIAYENDLPFNLDNNLSERKLGNLKELGEFMKDREHRRPHQPRGECGHGVVAIQNADCQKQQIDQHQFAKRTDGEHPLVAARVTIGANQCGSLPDEGGSVWSG